MRIQLGGLSDGIHEYNFACRPAEIGLDERFQTEIHVHALLDKTVHQAFLKAEISTSGLFACDRCVRDVSLTFSPGYRMYYVVEGGETGDLDPSEVQVIPPGLNAIDIDDDVRQILLLAIPQKILCTRDCKGLCPECGRNRNADPCDCSVSIDDSRWEKLREIRDSGLLN